MFALAIWNPDARELFLARDRFGIKPLYVARGDGWFLFASEVRALLATGLVRADARSRRALAVPGLPDTPAPRTLISTASRCWNPGRR